MYKKNILLKYFFCNNNTVLSRKERISNYILDKFKPIHFDIKNESFKHSGTNNKSETHFKVCVVSNNFLNLTKIKRHQELHKLLSSEWGSKSENKLHSIEIEALTEEEYFYKLNKDKDNIDKDKSNFKTNCLNK